MVCHSHLRQRHFHSERPTPLTLIAFWWGYCIVLQPTSGFLSRGFHFVFPDNLVQFAMSLRRLPDGLKFSKQIGFCECFACKWKGWACNAERHVRGKKHKDNKLKFDMVNFSVRAVIEAVDEVRREAGLDTCADPPYVSLQYS